MEKGPLTYTPRTATELQSQCTRCYNCNEKGHLAYNSPQRSSLYCDSPGDSSSQFAEETMHSSVLKGSVNGQSCRVLLDTGTTQSMVHKDLVPDDSILKEHTAIRCAHGDSVIYPIAPIVVNIGGTRATIKAAISSTLPQPALIGWDAPEFFTLLKPQSRAWNGQLSNRMGIGTYRTINPRLRRRRRRGKCVKDLPLITTY